MEWQLRGIDMLYTYMVDRNIYIVFGGINVTKIVYQTILIWHNKYSKNFHHSQRVNIKIKIWPSLAYMNEC